MTARCTETGRKSVNDCKFTEIEGRVMPLGLEVTVHYQFARKTVTCNRVY